MSSRKVNLTFTDESVRDLENLSQNLNTPVDRVIGQALALLKLVQGRKIILEDKKESVEISNYSNLPPQVPIKK